MGSQHIIYIRYLKQYTQLFGSKSVTTYNFTQTSLQLIYIVIHKTPLSYKAYLSAMIRRNYKRGNLSWGDNILTFSVHMKFGLISGQTLGERGLKRGCGHCTAFPSACLDHRQYIVNVPLTCKLKFGNLTIIKGNQTVDIQSNRYYLCLTITR